MNVNKRFILFAVIGMFLLIAIIAIGGIIFFLLYEKEDEVDLVEDDDMEAEVTEEGIPTEIVDEDGWVGIDNDIAVDGNNNPHISYYDQGNRDLKYATKVNDEWQNETVDSKDDVGEAGGIALDKDGNPHISYIDATNGHCKYARKIGGSWDIVIVEQAPAGYFAMSTSIALDKDDHPYIVYNFEFNMGKATGDIEEDDNHSEEGVKYARWDGSSWQIETIADSGTDVYLVLDSNDIPHISFKKGVPDSEGSIIRYATKTADEWKVEIVDASTVAGGDTGIAVDSEGRPHIAYNDYGNEAKMYAYWDGESWQTQVVAVDTDEGEGTKIAIDNNDYPRIVYNNYAKEPCTLMYAAWNGSLWDVKIVDKAGISSIIVDRGNHAHIAYTQSREDKENAFSEIRREIDQEDIEILKYAFID